MLRYVEDNEEVAHQYAHALVNFFTIDLDIPEVLQLARDIVTESTNDIRNFEGEGGGEPDRRRTAAADRPCQGRAGRLNHPPHPHNATDQPTGKEGENEHRHLPH